MKNTLPEKVAQFNQQTWPLFKERLYTISVAPVAYLSICSLEQFPENGYNFSESVFLENNEFRQFEVFFDEEVYQGLIQREQEEFLIVIFLNKSQKQIPPFLITKLIKDFNLVDPLIIIKEWAYPKNHPLAKIIFPLLFRYVYLSIHYPLCGLE